MRVWTISLILLFAIGAASAADLAPLTIQGSPGEIRPKDWTKVKVDSSDPRRYIEFTRDVELTCPLEKGQTIQRKVIVRRSIYPIEQILRGKNFGDWLVVPALSSHKVKFGYNNSAGRTRDYAHFIAVDPSTLAIFPHEIVGYTQEWQRLDGTRWPEGNWTFGCVPTIGPMAGQAVVRTATGAEFVAEQERQGRQMVHIGNPPAFSGQQKWS